MGLAMVRCCHDENRRRQPGNQERGNLSVVIVAGWCDARWAARSVQAQEATGVTPSRGRCSDAKTGGPVLDERCRWWKGDGEDMMATGGVDRTAQGQVRLACACRGQGTMRADVDCRIGWGDAGAMAKARRDCGATDRARCVKGPVSLGQRRRSRAAVLHRCAKAIDRGARCGDGWCGPSEEKRVREMKEMGLQR